MNHPKSLQQEKNNEKYTVGRGTHLFIATCTALCILFSIWAFFSKLDIVSMAEGRIIPSSKVKKIQHLEGGIIREIRVGEGDRVVAGQPLMVLEETVSGASVEELIIRIAAFEADIARLEALNENKNNPGFPEDLIRNNPDLVKQAENLFDVQHRRHGNEVEGQKELIEQRTQDISAIQAKIRNNRQSLRLLEKQITISKGLLKDKLTTEYKHLDFLREATSLKSGIEQDLAALQKAFSARKEAQEKLKRIRHAFREETGKALKKAKQNLSEISQRLKKHADSLKRTTIRSPVDGIVKTLYMFTVKGVVKPGMTIMDIVPASDRLIVEAHLPIGDIGYIRTGQRAIIKLASRDALRFGKIEGKVAHVSPDTFSSSQGNAFYTVHIRTEKDYFERENMLYRLYPGVKVIAFIHTGQRTVFEYLLDPFINTLGNALQER